VLRCRRFRRKERTALTGIALFAKIKEEFNIWCKHKANPHRRARKRVVSGGQEDSEIIHMLLSMLHFNHLLVLMIFG